MTARRRSRTRKATKDPRGGLTAAAWGEPVPKTVAAARRIAAKGKRLLAAYKRNSEQKKPRGRGRAPARLLDRMAVPL